jgi:shikimate kinase
VHVRGRSDVDGGIVQLDASVSSQFVSSLLLVGARLRRGITIEFPGAVASFDYAVWTCRTLARFGVGATLTPTGAAVPPGCRFVAPTQPIVVDGDWSSMGVWTCLAHLNGSRLVATNLRPDSGQADEGLARVLAEWPATGEHTIDVAPLPDQFLVLAVVAAFWPGTTRFVGGANLRHKECDRLAVMARELRRIGGDVDELPDGLVVRGGRPLRGATIDPAADHRVAMALALAGLLVGGMRIALPDCVAKSYPSFWRDLAQVAASRLPVVVVGMRGVGKSTFARAFAATAAAECIDVDAEFVGRHGPIAEFVAAHGWPRFRAEEERLLAAALRPGCVVATGGGAIESEATRRLLRDRALVVWLAADATLVRQRLSAAATDAAPRPSVTGRGLLDEVPTLLARRDPLYAEVATVRLDAALPTATLCAMAQERLARRTVAAG